MTNADGLGNSPTLHKLRIMELELRHLRTICAIADSGSVTRAAATLGATQPAVSAQLRRIERLLGGDLFVRSRNGVVATEYGAGVLARARSVLAEVSQLRWQRPVGASVIRVGGVSGPILVGWARRLAALFPETEISVHNAYSPKVLADMVGADRLDAASLVDYPGHELRVNSSVSTALVAAEPLRVALRSGHHLARRRTIDLAELAAEPWVLSCSDGAGWPDYFYEACCAAGFTPAVRHHVTALAPLHEILAGGLAISPCQATFAPPPGVVVLPLTGDPMLMRHLIGWQSFGRLAGYAGRLLQFARDTYKTWDRSPIVQPGTAHPGIDH
jgi:DNA-binding transcriptional LysR family regulator